MSSSEVYYDAGFRPDIRKHLPDDAGLALVTWEIAAIGEPVPSERLRKVAVWFGSALTRYRELPVIAAVAPIKQAFRPPVGEWYCGLAHGDTVLEQPDPRLALLDAAEIPVQVPKDAISLLIKLMTPYPYEQVREPFRLPIPRR